MTRPTLLILAAGIGSRYGGFKQIDPLGPGGEISLDYALFDAWRAGFGKAVFVIRPELEAPIREHFGDRLQGKLETAFVFQAMDDLPAGFTPPPERKKPWGTGHAVRAARAVVKEPFAAINADDFYGPAAYQAMAEFFRDAPASGGPHAFSMVGFPVRNTLSPHGAVSRGICDVDAAGCLREVVERVNIESDGRDGARYLDETGAWRALPGTAVASMNFWGFTPALFSDLDGMFDQFLAHSGQNLKAEFFIPSVVDALIKRGVATCRVLPTHDRWFGMTYPEDRPEVQQNIRALIAAGVYPERLWQET